MTYMQWRQEINLLSKTIYASHQKNDTIDIFTMLKAYPDHSLPTVREAVYELEHSGLLHASEPGIFQVV